MAIDINWVLEGVIICKIHEDFLASLTYPQLFQGFVVNRLDAQTILEMRLLNVVSELHLPSNAVPVIPEVFVDVQIPDSPLHVHVRRLLKKLTGDTCSPDHFQVLPKEHAKREHKQQDECVIGAI